MATGNADHIEHIEMNNEDTFSNIILNDVEKAELNRRRIILENELQSLSALLTMEKNRSEHESVKIIENDRVSNTSVPPFFHHTRHTPSNMSSGTPFYGFSPQPERNFRHVVPVSTNSQTVLLERNSNRTTPVRIMSPRMSNVDNIPESEQQVENLRRNSALNEIRPHHQEVNVNIRENAEMVNRDLHSPQRQSSHRSSAWETIDQWVDEVSRHNQQILSAQVNNEISTNFNRTRPQVYYERDNISGSTKVELQNAPYIGSRYGKQGADQSDRFRFTKGNSSTDVIARDTWSNVSHNELNWGSVDFELPNTSGYSRHYGQQRLFRDHQLEQLDHRTQGVAQFTSLPRRKDFDRNLVDQRHYEQLNTNLDFNCAEPSYQKPHNSHGRGSMKIEKQNTPILKEFCGGEYGRTNDQVDQQSVFHGKPEYDRNREINFPPMSASNYHKFGQSYDQGYKENIYPINDRQKNFVNSSDNKAPPGERFDRPKAHDGPFGDQRYNVSQPNMQSLIQTPQTPMEMNNDIMTKLMSRQILGKDLPEFFGDSSKWLTFIDHYDDTTKSCHFTDRENIIRLRKCLKGKARDMVEPLLASATSAKQIIEVLRRRYGRPEDIIKAEVQKVKALPAPKEDNPISIIEFATAVQNLVVTFETLKKPNHLKNPILLEELQEKLPTTLNLLWSEYIVDRKDELTLRVFADWLERRAEAASRRTTFNVYKTESTQSTQKPKFNKARINMINTTSGDVPISSCYSCHGTCKSLESCEAFATLDVHKRWELVKKNKLCFFCLSANHEFKDCPKKVECRIKGCKRFHHKLLHTQVKKVGIIKANIKSHVTKLRIVPVTLFGKSTEIKTFALLDPGSTSTLMSEHLSNSLKLDGPNSPLLLEWMNGDMAVENDSKIVDTKIQGIQDGAKIYDLFNVRTVKNLPLHKQTIDKAALVKQWPYLRTVDFEGYENAQPELLIGENNGLLTATRQLVHDKWNTPIASKTWLGWVISGNEGKSTDTAVVKIFTAHEVETDSLHELVKSSFSMDEAGVSSQKLSRSKEDERALQLLEKYSIVNDNRWETGLLWRDEQVILPESRKNALLRLIILEKKLDKNPDLRQRYNEIIGEYLDKKFLRKCEKTDMTPQRLWYLPHFPVLYPLKPGKVRIVFDAAAKSNGLSLNDYLMPGPDFLQSLIGVLFKFRHGKIGFLGDIKDMFHRIKIRQQDASCQKILWRGNSRTCEPEEYQLDVMSFGANCSPCSAIYIKDQNALRFQKEFPQAVDAILNKHYMDDYLDSSSNEDEAIKIINDVIYVHQQGSFEIRNWTSSSQVVMEAIPEHLRRNYTSKKVSLDHENLQDRVLGILWDPTEDVFTFSTDFAKLDRRLLSGEMKPTKRDILKIINSVFDPLGFVAHLMIIGKIILKNVWRSGIGWDEVIDDTIFETWKSFLIHIQRITEIKIDRCYSINFMQTENLQLHVFCDASIEAYSAVAFVRVPVGDEIEIKFVMAKTRLTSMKTSSVNNLIIPRLELEAALLGSKISHTIMAEHNVKFDKLVLWTDNTAVWYWIKSETKRYKQFVANRLSEILELTNPSNWMWVPTDMNPADDATRSNKVPEFGPNSRWYRGPDFLYDNEVNWPEQPNKRMKLTNDLIEVLEFSNFVIEKPNFQVPNATRFSKWLRLLRATSWLLRFINNCKKNQTKVKGFELTVDETNKAEMLLVKDSQRRCFPNEIAHLQKGKIVDVNSQLYSLCPKLDENGIMRMCGRTDRLPDSLRGLKEPVILDGKDYCVKLLIRYFHGKANHFGHEMVLNELRQRYWIIGARVALRAVRNECSKCKLLLVQPSKIIMGQLPSARVTGGNSAFTFCGVDYFGPILVKQNRSTVKRYGVLFTCLTVRAVHIEIAHSLTTDSCIMALRRFTAKNICPTEMYSDNGTNLRGCDTELQANLKELDQDKIRGWMTTHRIKWFFNPPTAASMGGSWERLVRSIKTALYATLDTIHPTDEVLATLLAEAQHVTNSRPLLEISDHPNEEETLTPNHFLIGRSSASAPIGEFDSDDLILKKQWRASQHLADLFWNRWLKEFLPTLTKRTKWFLSTRKPKIGDLVLIADPDEKRGNWPRGIITAVFPGMDNEIRVVDVTTHSGTYRRPMNKICLLESTVVAGEDV